MKQTDPHAIDFAALRTLCLVHSEKSFSAAAIALQQNQSTVSYTIDRLRRAFDDPLFVRQGAAITPTMRCDEIVQTAEQLLDQYAQAILPTEFDPASAVATITVSSNYYERVTLLPGLARALRSKAPGIHLKMVQSSTEGDQHLRNGQSDLLLTPVRIDDPGLYTRRLFSDHYVCIMDRDNPISRAPLTRDIYCAANHAVVTYGGNWRSFYMVELEAQGLRLNRSLSIPSPESMSQLLAGTDMISTIPNRIADTLPPDIAVCPCPFPAPFEVSMYWGVRTHQSKMQRWLRALIAQTASEIMRKS